MKRGWNRAVIVMLTMASAIALATIILAACGTAATPTPASLAEAYVSSNLPTAYEGALPASTQLVLGTLNLEGTASAVTPEQARTLLPLWQALQGGAVQGVTEVNAVLGQIERAMTSEQLKAIAGMQLTQDDLAAWTQESGLGMGQPPGGPGGTPRARPQGTPGAWPGGTPGPGGQGGTDPAARETMRAGFDSMSEEERAQLMATMQAGGMPAGGFGGRTGQAGADMGQFRFLVSPLIELLTQRAGS